jgi:hypothetical protein
MVEDYHIWIGIHHDVAVLERVDLSWVDFHTINDHEGSSGIFGGAFKSPNPYITIWNHYRIRSQLIFALFEQLQLTNRGVLLVKVTNQ